MAFRNPYAAAKKPAFAGGHSGHDDQALVSSSFSPLVASVSSRNGHYNRATNSMSKIYRQASTLFLTRRLPEALTTILPLITSPQADDGVAKMLAITNGDVDGSVSPVLEPAPLAGASRSTRVKVWSLYLTILNAILELEPDEGKDAFGTQDWRALCSKVRDGDVWEEVVRNGYHGQEGEVDADVVINLATLLLAHAKSQVLNQKRLEAYLSYSQVPNFDLTNRFDASPTRRTLSRQRSPPRGASGADTPRDLNSRVKILELYTLHVLMRNDEWDYAREFISASPILDEERREAFLLALQSLQEDQQITEKREVEENKRLDEQRQHDLEDVRRLRAENEERERRRIDEERARRDGTAGSETGSQITTRRHKAPSSAGESTSVRGNAGRSRTSRSSRPNSVTGMVKPGSSHSPSSKSKGSKSKAVVPAPTLATRTAKILSNLQFLLGRMSAALGASPVALVRTLVFIMALLAMLGRRNMRERVARILGSGWTKVRATAGMGVKVSYM